MNREVQITFINPLTKKRLIQRNGALVEEGTGHIVAPIVNNVPRFVKSKNYSDSFGWQWNKWENNQSESRGSKVPQFDLIIRRTNFDKLDLAGKTILECGMGGGDDTEVLLKLPFKEVHSFDLSNSVDRAKKFLHDERLTISQASIYEIPYPDGIFDFVYCHRVLQHTPDPEKSLKAICKKVKPGGHIFVHSYKKSKEYMQEWRYKYRWITKRMPMRLVYLLIEVFGGTLHRLNKRLYRKKGRMRNFAFRYIPFYYVDKSMNSGKLTDKELLEFEKLITFDALTPAYDSPMATETMERILNEEGFEILFLEDKLISPVYATARRLK